MRVAIYQSAAVPLTRNERLDSLCVVAENTPADLILCPELFVTGYAPNNELERYAEPADGVFSRGVSSIAQATRKTIVYGYPEIDTGRLYNSAQCVDASGVRLANHRKLVLAPGFERDTFTAGSRPTLFELDGLMFGLMICYDIEFPEAARASAQAGAHVILAPTALGEQWSVVAHKVIPTRAFENGLYVLYANHSGTEGDMIYLGASCIVGPDGLDVARAGSNEQVICATLDASQVAIARQRLPYLQDLGSLCERLSGRAEKVQ